MSNLYLTSTGAGQTSIISPSISSIGYGSSGALTINSTAGVNFYNSAGTASLGASITTNGILNCTGLTITGTLSCTGLTITSGGSITCLGSLICSSSLNMNNNAISGVSSLACIGAITGVTSANFNSGKVIMGDGMGVKTYQHGFTMNEGSYTYIMNVHYSDGSLYITRASDATAASATSIFTASNGILYWARGGSGWTYSSDKRLKKNIEYLNSCLDSVLLLKPCTFRYNGSNDDSKLNYGFIAQDVQEIYPDIISTSALNDEKFLGLSITDIIPILTKAVQELNTKIDDQSSEIVHLSSHNAAMNVEVTSLTSQVASLTTHNASLVSMVSNMAAEMDALIARVNLLISNHSDPADPTDPAAT